MTQDPDSNPFEQYDRIIREAGGDPESAVGKRAREIIHTAAKLIRDEADLGEMKLISSSLKELRYALKVFRDYKANHKITIFGSARTPEQHPDYQACLAFSRAMAEAGWMVITGAGDGIMRAGHGGAGTEQSFGVSIRLPFETNANEYIVGDPKLIVFRYFFTRKLMFLWQCHAIALFPGGFGTQDEAFESLTLIQTGKAPTMPIVMCEGEGGDYWQHWESYIRRELLDNGWISEEDPGLYYIAETPAAAANHVLQFYRNYHSQRFVRDRIVLRVQRPLSEETLDAINTDFAELVQDGVIEQGGPLPGEKDALALPRVHFHYTKHRYGRLRALIDRINEADAAEA